jgi:lysophospholipase L1-like esterase
METDKKLSLKRKLLYISVPYIIVAVFFAFSEMSVRLLTSNISSLELFTKENFEEKVESEHGEQIFSGDALLGWKLMSNMQDVHWDFTTFSTNKQGIRYHKNLGKKKKDTIRIVCLGDSITFGYRVPTTFPQNPYYYEKSHIPYPSLIEKYLQTKNPNKTVEVIPMAVPGYTTYQGLRWIEKDINSLRPDLVVVLFGWNDSEMHPQSDKEALPDSWHRAAQRALLSKSQALIYSSNWIGSKKKSETKERIEYKPRVSREDYILNILSIKDMAKEYGSEILVLGPIIRDSVAVPAMTERLADYRTALSEAMSKTQTNYLEIEELTETEYPENNELFGELVHPNYLGHQLMAEKILELIKEQELLKEVSI